MAAAGIYSPCGLREGHRHQQQNRNLFEKGCSEKTLGMEGNKRNRQTHRIPHLCEICKQGTAATGRYSPCGLRECRQHQQQNRNLFEKGCDEKTFGMGEKNIKNTDKLTIARFSMWFASGG
jgi:hypothetical protein